MRALILLLLVCLLAATSGKSVKKRQAVDFNDPLALSEAITAMIEGEIQFPQHNPENLLRSGFDCHSQPMPGYYADVELDCQVFHHCDQERGIEGTHVCPNMTVFSQEFFTCMWYPTVDCSEAPTFYSLNENLYKSPNTDLWGRSVEKYDEEKTGRQNF